MPFFRKKKPPASDPLLLEMDNRHREMNERFVRIEAALERLAAASPNITIDQVHIHQPVLERMEYRLDRLDIDQLSGSLNLGNNFGAKVGRIAHGGKKQPSGSTGQDKKAELSQTPTGYRYTKS